MEIKIITDKMKKAGVKLTKKRLALLKVLISSSAPLTEKQIQQKLRAKNVSPNKTTVYRQLDKLLRLKIVEQVEFGDRKKRYELTRTHHHHLVCKNCGAIKEIKLPNDLKKQEKLIERLKNFQIISHNLEFFGLCSKCK